MISEQTKSEISGKYVGSPDQYAIYLRKSRADLEMEALGEGETLARHKKMLDSLAAKHNIHPNQITVYKEIVSGDSISDRPEMQRLLSDVYKKKYKGVLVVEVERLARGNTKDQGEVADAFQASGTHIITPAKVYDPNNEFDQEYFEFGLFMSRREYKTIRRRMVVGKEESVKEGNYLLPQRVFGFDIVRKSKRDRYLVKNEEEAKIVQMIFDWYTEENKSYNWIANQLTLMGVKTVKNRPEWNKGTITSMIQSVYYIGKIPWGKERVVKVFDEKAGKLVKRKVPGKKEIYEGKHKGFISIEQFEKAQEIANSKKPPVKKETRMINPLAGMLKCCDCGSNIVMFDLSTYRNDNTESRFQHPARQKCKKKSLPVGVVVDGFIQALKAHEADLEIKMKNDSNKADLVRHEEILKTMEAELQKTENRKRRLFDSWEADDGTYTRDEFIERKQMYTQEIESLKERIAEAKTTAPEPVDYEEKIVNIHAMIDCIKDPEIDVESKNSFLKQFIDFITYDVIDLGRGKGGIPVLNVFMK